MQMPDADEFERRARQHDRVADARSNRQQAFHEGIAEGYRRAAQILADAETPDTPRPQGAGHTVVVRPVGAEPRRYRIEPALNVQACAWWIEEEWTGCTWRVVGREALEEATLNERPAFVETGVVGP